MAKLLGPRKVSLLLLFGLGTVALSCSLAYIHILSTSWHLQATSEFMRSYSQTPKANAMLDELVPLRKLATQRAALYIREIDKRHLQDGLLVNRKSLDQASGICDSLLFSSIYYVSLKKLGYKKKAAKLWTSITKANYGGHWFRHPSCTTPTSRDMVLGVLLALSQKPRGYDGYLKSFLSLIQDNDGFFSYGPSYISHIGPGISDVLRKFTRQEGMSYESLPNIIRASFSTIEVTLPFVSAGYRSHLESLVVWLELELDGNQYARTRTIARPTSSLLADYIPKPLYKQRLEYITQSLVEKDPANTFFRFLRYRTAGAVNQQSRAMFLNELVNMPQFPAHRLPSDCDRKADYLWQRSSDEYSPKSSKCVKQFSGVDYLWMLANILDPV